MKKIKTISFLSVLFVILQSGGCNNVKELDYIGIQSTSIESINLKNAALRINLEYYNPNKFGIDVKETNLSIYLNDKFVALADQPEKTQIPKLSNFTFPVVAHFDPFKILGTAFSSLFSKTSKMTILGTAKLGKGGVYIKVPISITENVSLLRQ
ncbi:hypothetical protein EMGBS15_04680 [Filimonas sp.]|nr:hypothetical protein EMGBS15_04680 [Filimonas sp.]